MVRNEIDVIGGVLQHMAAEVDLLIVADNGSTDGTRELLDALTDELPLTVVDDPDPAYRQSEKMSRLAALAGEAGADWCVPFDADELWYSPLGHIRDVLALTVGNIAPADLYNHWPSAVDPGGPDPFRTIGWREQEPAKLPKVAFRWRPGTVIHQGNHGVTIPGPRAEVHGVLALRHFPYRTPGQFTAKAVQGLAALRAAPDLPPSSGAHWRLYGEAYERGGAEAVEAIFREHFWYLSPLDSGLVHDPAPYQRWATSTPRRDVKGEPVSHADPTWRWTAPEDSPTAGTVGDLRRLLEGIPDNMPLALYKASTVHELTVHGVAVLALLGHQGCPGGPVKL
jgi:hypothetical protein